MKRIARLSPMMLIACAACIPTLQSPRIDPGWRVDVAALALSNTRDNSVAHVSDYMVTVVPAYGFGRRVELGLPLGTYGSDWHSFGPSAPEWRRALYVAPYAKVALLDPDAKDHLALSGQAALIIPANVGIHYGHDFGNWEPQVSISWMFSAGPSGDDPIITRYQQENQSLMSAAVGATFNHPARPAIEVGVLRNAYGTNGPSNPRTIGYDVFLGMRVGIVR